MANSNNNTILLGGWAAFSALHGLTQKELPETFGWMKKDQVIWYEDLRISLDLVPGSREYLRSLKPDERHDAPIIREVENKMSSAHSGASSSSLLGSYRAALGDWDGWVAQIKHTILRSRYRDEQIDLYCLVRFQRALNDPNMGPEHYQLLLKDANIHFLDEGKSVHIGWGHNGKELKGMLKTIAEEIRAFKAEDEANWENVDFEEHIQELECNLKDPQRWFWPGEPSPCSSITAEMMDEMETRHPGYREHIALVCTHLNNFGFRAGVKWSLEYQRTINEQLRALGILR
jgi:hypothetical protein